MSGSKIPELKKVGSDFKNTKLLLTKKTVSNEESAVHFTEVTDNLLRKKSGQFDYDFIRKIILKNMCNCCFLLTPTF
jgi:hypothetical protein